MLKYQVRAYRSTSSFLTPSSSCSSANSCSGSSNEININSRSNSLSSLNSLESNGNDGEFGTIKIYTQNVRSCTDYKTLRVSTHNCTAQIIDTVINKFKLSSRDVNLYEIWMEITTKVDGRSVRTVLKLGREARPLELQRCHPVNMSRFILHMKTNGQLVKIYDHNIAPQSNYKSLLLSSITSCNEAIQLILSMNRKNITDNFGLFLTSPDGEAQIPNEVGKTIKFKEGMFGIIWPEPMFHLFIHLYSMNMNEWMSCETFGWRRRTRFSNSIVFIKNPLLISKQNFPESWQPGPQN